MKNKKRPQVLEQIMRNKMYRPNLKTKITPGKMMYSTWTIQDKYTKTTLVLEKKILLGKKGGLTEKNSMCKI